MVSVWEALFMLVVLKIPVVYLGAVVWWAIRAEPVVDFGDGEETPVREPLDPCGWDDFRRRRAARRRPLPPRRPVTPKPHALSAGATR
jgi:hypothetical protein